MVLSWNDVIAIIQVAAKRQRNILEHEAVCAELTTMFLAHFNYQRLDEIVPKITDILRTFYMETVERNKLFWRGAGDTWDIAITELSKVIHAQ